MPVLAICSDCDAVFSSNAINLRDGVIINCQVSGCPNCGGIGDIVDGRYHGHFVQVFRQDQWALLVQVASQVEREIKSGIPPAEAIDKAAGKDSKLATYLKGFIPRNFKDLNDAAKFFGIIAAIGVAAMNLDKIDNVPTEVEEALNGIRSSGALEPDDNHTDIRNLASSTTAQPQAKELSRDELAEELCQRRERRKKERKRSNRRKP